MQKKNAQDCLTHLNAYIEVLFALHVLTVPGGNQLQRPDLLLKMVLKASGLLQPARMPLHCHGKWETLHTSHAFAFHAIDNAQQQYTTDQRYAQKAIFTSVLQKQQVYNAMQQHQQLCKSRVLSLMNSILQVLLFRHVDGPKQLTIQDSKTSEQGIKMIQSYVHQHAFAHHLLMKTTRRSRDTWQVPSHLTTAGST